MEQENVLAYIRNGTILSDGAAFENPGIVLKGGRIAGFSSHPPENGRILDAMGLLISPGFLDIHTHGAVGHDCTEGTREAFQAISRYQASHGVTALAATTFTMPLRELLRCAEFMRSLDQSALPGARFLGLHLEGPFLSQANRGAHSAPHILPPLPEYYEPLLAYSDVIRSMTFSPGSLDAARMAACFRKRGVILSGGHDDGWGPTIEPAVLAGMSHTTHLFCAMSTLTRREGRKALGLTELALLDDRLTAEVIADNVHTDGNMVRLAYKCKGAKGLCLVSDMLSVGGLPPGDSVYTLAIPGVDGGLPVVVENQVAKLADRSMNAGSITPLDRMVRNVIEYGLPASEVLSMVTSTPARILGESSRGSVQPGYYADFCLLDTNYYVQGTIVHSSLVYSAKKAWIANEM